MKTKKKQLAHPVEIKTHLCKKKKKREIQIVCGKLQLHSPGNGQVNKMQAKELLPSNCVKSHLTWPQENPDSYYALIIKHSHSESH